MSLLYCLKGLCINIVMYSITLLNLSYKPTILNATDLELIYYGFISSHSPWKGRVWVILILGHWFSILATACSHDIMVYVTFSMLCSDNAGHIM